MDVTGWTAIAWGAACGAGVVMFLKAVANGIEVVEADLRRLEQAERKALAKRKNAGLPDVSDNAVAA